MSEARDQFAKRLHGREYREEMTVAEEVEARDARLLVVFGASDDLTEYRGIIRNELGAWEGATHMITGSPKRWEVHEIYGEPRKGIYIDVKWGPKTVVASWLITPSVPFAPFDIMEDRELYCRGAVIDEADLLPVQRVLGVNRVSTLQALWVSFAAPVTDDDIRAVHDLLRAWGRYA